MTVRRLIADELFPPPDYSHAAVARGGLVHTAGTVPLDVEGNLVGPGDFAAQTRQTLAPTSARTRRGGRATGAGREDDGVRGRRAAR